MTFVWSTDLKTVFYVLYIWTGTHFIGTGIKINLFGATAWPQPCSLLWEVLWTIYQTHWRYVGQNVSQSEDLYLHKATKKTIQNYTSNGVQTRDTCIRMPWDHARSCQVSTAAGWAVREEFLIISNLVQSDINDGHMKRTIKCRIFNKRMNEDCYKDSLTVLRIRTCMNSDFQYTGTQQ
jgi:hypothetical protein